MKNYKPILMSDLDIRLPGIEILRVCLNRHLPEADWVRPHAHAAHCQFLLYLTGRGRQVIEGEEVAVGPGKLLFLAPGEEHAFRKERARRPLCLVVDLVLDAGVERCARERQMTSGEMTVIRRNLVRLHAAREDELGSGALILELAHGLVAAAGWVERKRSPRATPVTRKVERALKATDGLEFSPREIAERVGLQQDHLNRVLKRECGMTVGQMLAAARLAKAKQLLRTEKTVGDIAQAVGFLDQNYFARWFKQQTGLTPSEFRNI